MKPRPTQAAAPPIPGAPSAGDALTPGRFALLLGAFIVAAFPQVVIGLETFVVRDYGFFAFPLAHYQRECFWRGELPLWNPYNNCGVPFLAQWNTMPLYPPSLIYLILPLTWSLSFFCLLHLFWAGLGMYFLAHRWTGHRFAAAAAGLIFAFNGLSLNLLMWPSHIATLSWMPWVVLCVERAWQDGGRRLVVAALVGALQMLAGGPETILFTWLILAALWLAQLCPIRLQKEPAAPHCDSPGRSEVSKTPARAGFSRLPLSLGSSLFRISDFGFRISAPAAVWRFPLVVSLVGCLAAAQLLPFLDLAAHSQREEGFADARWSMPGWGWANFLVPMVFGNTWKQDLFFQYGQYWTSSYYLGVAALVLGGLAVWKARNLRVWLLAAACVTGFILAGGDQNQLSRWVRHAVPQLSMMTYPVKYVIVLIFGVPLLAGFAVARLGQASRAERGEWEKRLLALSALAAALICGILFWAWRWPFPLDDFRTTLHNGLSRLGLLAVAIGTLLALGRATRAGWRQILPIGFLVVCWLDVSLHEPTQNPTVPPWIYGPGLARQELAMQPQPELGQSRVMVAPAAETKFLELALSDPRNNFLAKRLGYFADCNLLDGVPKVNGFFSVYPRACGELNSVLYLSTNVCPPALLDFMSVSQLTTPGEYVKWTAHDSFLPLATAGQRPVFLDDTNALSYLIGPAFDGRKFVFLPPESRGQVSVTNQTKATVLSQRFAAQLVELEVEAAEPSLVTVSQTYYHRWQARVDGAPAPLLRANYAFQALQVPSGKHRVTLVYEDRAFHLGALISGVGLLLCLGGWLRFRKPSSNS